MKPRSDCWRFLLSAASRSSSSFPPLIEEPIPSAGGKDIELETERRTRPAPIARAHQPLGLCVVFSTVNSCSTFQSWGWWCTKGKGKVNRYWRSYPWPIRKAKGKRKEISRSLRSETNLWLVDMRSKRTRDPITFNPHLLSGEYERVRNWNIKTKERAVLVFKVCISWSCLRSWAYSCCLSFGI